MSTPLRTDPPRWPELLVATGILLLVVAVVATLLGAGDANARELRQPPAAVRAAITRHFGPDAGEAIAVARCETGGTFDVDAVNDVPGREIYLGLFQAGNWFRRTFGHGRTADAQAAAAARGFRANGRCWTCNRQWPTCGRGLD